MGVNLSIMVGSVRVGATALIIGDIEFEFPVNKMFSDIYEDFFDFDKSLSRVDCVNLAHANELIHNTGMGEGFSYCNLEKFIDFIETHAKELKTIPKEIMYCDGKKHEGKREDAVWEYPRFKAIMKFLKTLNEAKFNRNCVFFYWS